MTTTPKKRSFFERLTGSIHIEDDEPVVSTTPTRKTSLYQRRYEENYEDDDTIESSLEVIAEEEFDEPTEAELSVDVYETNDAIVIKTMTAGVKKEDLQIIVSRESLILRGKRDNDARAYQHHYHTQELYWGPFSREITLPDEVAIDDATATEYHGLITIKLPKFDKKRKATLKIQ